MGRRPRIRHRRASQEEISLTRAHPAARPPRPRPSRPLAAGVPILLLAAAGGLALVEAHVGMHADAQVPITVAGATTLATDLASGAVVDADLVCDVDGPLVAVHPDPDPLTSGLHGVVVVSGMPILVPASVPIQLGDTPGDHIAFLDLLATPMGFPSFLGAEASVAGSLALLPDVGSGPHVRCTADAFLLAVGHPPLLGVVSSNGPGGLRVNDVPIVPHPDPRVAPFVRVMDLAGAQLAFADLPEGKLVSVNGDYDATAGHIQAIMIVLESLVPPAPGEADHVSILRAEARAVRNELRVRGFSNNATTTISLFDFSAGVAGAQLAAGIAVDPVDGVWEFRGDFAPLPTPSGAPERILAKTLSGGAADAFVSIR